ncbi:MAG: LPS export ABC transporter periplasmic protein LptC [Bacteroidota bacterium]
MKLHELDFNDAMIHFVNKFYKSITIFFLMVMLFSCKPDLETIETITKIDNQPVESGSNLEIIYSSNAEVQMIMTAPQMDKYATEEPYMELPQGFIMTFYDSLMRETSRISANYAIQYEENELIDARNDVVVENMETQEKLNSEQLIWDSKNEIIHTEKFVKITTGEEVLYGDGFESDDRFTSWSIKNPRGTFYVETGEDTNDTITREQIQKPEVETPPTDTLYQE